MISFYYRNLRLRYPSLKNFLDRGATPRPPPSASIVSLRDTILADGAFLAKILADLIYFTCRDCLGDLQPTHDFQPNTCQAQVASVNIAPLSINRGVTIKKIARNLIV